MQQSRFFHRLIPTSTLLVPLVIGLCAGIVNGLLGAGGGIIAVLALNALVRAKQPSGPTDQTVPTVQGGAERDIFATSLLAMLPISVLSALQYAAAGRFTFSSFAPLLLPSLIGGIAGGLLLDRLKLPLLQKLFAYILLISGVRMLLS